MKKARVLDYIDETVGDMVCRVRGDMESGDRGAHEVIDRLAGRVQRLEEEVRYQKELRRDDLEREASWHRTMEAERDEHMNNSLLIKKKKP